MAARLDMWGLTLPVNGLRRQVAQARAMTMARMAWRGLATPAVAGPFDRRVRPHRQICHQRARRIGVTPAAVGVGVSEDSWLAFQVK